MFIVTFGQVTSDDTYEMHDQANAPLELPPSQVVAWDPVSFVSDKSVLNRTEKRPKLLKKAFRSNTASSFFFFFFFFNIIITNTVFP